MGSSLQFSYDRLTKIKSSDFKLHKIFDATLNRNSKTFTVTSNEIWKLNFAHVNYTSTATAGNRLLKLTAKDHLGNAVFSVNAGAVQTLSLTRNYEFAQGVFRETAFIGVGIQVPIPKDFYFGPNYSITIADSTNVDANDDMTVSMQFKKYLA